MPTRLPGLPGPDDEEPNALPVQPELQPELPTAPADDEPGQPVEPDHRNRDPQT